MKIVLPKTLAEPLTIPWFMINKGVENHKIVMIIQDYFLWLKTTKISPGAIEGGSRRVSCQQVLNDMIAIVVKKGGLVHSVNHKKMFTGMEHTGHKFIIEFWTPITRGKLARASFCTSFK